LQLNVNKYLIKENEVDMKIPAIIETITEVPRYKE